MAKGKTEIIRKVREFYESIRNLYPIKKVVLYGSYARGNPTKDSDIDVLVVVDLPEKTNTIKINSRLFGCASEVDSQIEPFCVLWDKYQNCDKSSILAEIKRTGIPIT